MASFPPFRPHPPPSLRQLQVLYAGMLVGPAAFAVVVPLLLEPEVVAAREETGSLAAFVWLAVAVGVVQVPLAFAFRARRWATARTMEGEQRLAAYGSGVVVFGALVEGGILLNVVGALVTHALWPGGAMAAVLLAIGVVNAPRRSQLRRLED